MSNSYFLWPESRFHRGVIKSLKLHDITEIEVMLKKMYGQGFPVVVSSARVGIVLTLTIQELTRPDKVGVFPYASYCVLEAISRVATPFSNERLLDSKLDLIYHQWGYVQKQNLHENGKLIEDAVDSFCLPGVKLFPLNGLYEIWSFPKLIGSLGGGVVWCRDEQTADQLRVLRDTRQKSTQIRWMLRLFSQYFSNFSKYWYGTESLGGPLPRWAAGDILYGLECLEKIATKRKERIGLLESKLPEWLHPSEKRLPCVIPVEVSDEEVRLLNGIGLKIGLRTFQRIDNNESSLVKLFPIPVHQDIPCELLDKALKVLSK